MTKTPWFPPEIAPAHPGFYEHAYPEQLRVTHPFDYWDGRRWCLGYWDAMRQCMDFIAAGPEKMALPWRGRVEP